MLTPAPHQPQPTRSHPSPKRTRSKDQVPATTRLTPQTLQTTGFNTPRRRQCSIDDNISPRTSVSNKFHRLGIQGNLSPTNASSWTANLIMPDKNEIPRSFPASYDHSMVIEETPEPSISGTTDHDSSSDDEVYVVPKNATRNVFQFGSRVATTSNNHSPGHKNSTSKRARFGSAGSPTLDFSPAKRRRTSLSPPSNLSIPASPPPPPLSPSPFAKKQPQSPKPESTTHSTKDSATTENSGSEGGEVDPDIAEFWWQPSEITGHTPDDPDEDNYGVNGIGYQKTKAEAYSISQKKKKQLAEWRSRETREARALRAGGRKSMAGVGVATGRVTKSGSRSGSPVAAESGRRSPFSPRKEREEKIARAVKFEIG